MNKNDSLISILEFGSTNLKLSIYNNQILNQSFFYEEKIEYTKNENLIENNLFNLILKAHPWIKNLNDCYLSDISDGGGGAHEYSHAIHMALVLKNFIFKKPLSMTYDLTYKKLNKKQYDSETIISFYNKLQRLNLLAKTKLLLEQFCLQLLMIMDVVHQKQIFLALL